MPTLSSVLAVRWQQQASSLPESHQHSHDSPSGGCPTEQMHWPNSSGIGQDGLSLACSCPELQSQSLSPHPRVANRRRPEAQWLERSSDLQQTFPVGLVECCPDIDVLYDGKGRQIPITQASVASAGAHEEARDTDSGEFF